MSGPASPRRDVPPRRGCLARNTTAIDKPRFIDTRVALPPEREET